MKKLAIIGAGNLGLSLAYGVVEKQLAEAKDVTLTRRDVQSLDSASNKGFPCLANNSVAAAAADIVFLCVQPKQLQGVLAEIKPVLKDQILVSVITGISIQQIQEAVGDAIPVVRAMPNIAASIGESMTCLASSDLSKATIKNVEPLFSSIGKTLIIEEELMQAATVLGASGIAFFMRYLRAATQGGVQMGFHSEDAQLIAVQTAKGAASLILEHAQHPEVEIDKVTTPQGCTIEGLNEMEHQGFSSALIRGIMTSYERITKMKSVNHEPL